ncbi:hypothetical protein GCM10018954_050470 [Kutzneria kofuensis]
MIAAVVLAACPTPPAHAAAAPKTLITGDRVVVTTPGSTSLRLVVPPKPAAATPHFPLTTLQINAVDIGGHPADSLAYLVNTDDVTREQALVPVAGGIGRIAVPAGHYFVLATFTDYDADDNQVANRMAVVNDFTVAPAPAVNAVTIDERTATARTGVTTPKPATQDGSMLQLARLDAAGGGVGVSLANLGGPNPPLYISPTPAAAVGKLHYVYQWDGTGDDYRYDVAFPSDKGIPADEVFAVKAGQLATVTQRFDVDKPGTGSFLNGATDPLLSRFGVDEIGSLDGVPMPRQFTEYLGTADGGQWVQTMATPDIAAEFDGDVVTYQARRDYQVSWGHGPLAPGFGNSRDPSPYCAACTSGSTLGLRFNELNDSVATHTGLASSASDHIQLFWNGKKVVDDEDTGAEAALPTTQGVLRAVLDTDRGGDPSVVHATTTHTEMTVKVTGSDTPMPPGGRCAGDAPCRILPALAVHYDLDTDLTGTNRSVLQAMSLTVGHLSYNGVGSHARIASAAVSVSFDGKAWLPAKVVGSNGKYVARWQNPGSAKGTKPSLRVTAADVNGNEITQTIADAYTWSA